MSKENIVKLYALLEKDLVLREKALSFQQMYSQQDQVIDAFMAFAADLGYEFTFQEFIFPGIHFPKGNHFPANKRGLKKQKQIYTKTQNQP